MPQLFGNFSADGSSDEIVVTEATLTIGDDSSDFGGGTVALEVRINDQADWTTDSTYTEAASKVTLNKKGVRMRFTLSGATSPDINYAISF